MDKTDIPTTEGLLKAYNILVRNIDDEAIAGDADSSRAYGGIIRAGKGLLVESLAKSLIRIAWKNLGGDQNRISTEKKPIIVPISHKYIQQLKNPDVKKYILENVDKYFYRFKTDVHVYIDGVLTLGVECKAYTENAMLKRIMVDFTFLKQVHPKTHAVLLQLESQLGGDYSKTLNKITYGSPSSHTIMSYFDIDLNIITLLEGERRVDQPIHKKDFYKELRAASLARAISAFENLMRNSL